MSDLNAKELVNIQAEDEALWFDARNVPEACLQSALRSLHNAVEMDFGDEFERGRQQGMLQERALWELAAEGQKIDRSTQAAQVSQQTATGNGLTTAYMVGVEAGKDLGRQEVLRSAPPEGQAMPVAWRVKLAAPESGMKHAYAENERLLSYFSAPVEPLYAAPQPPAGAVEKDAARYRYLCECERTGIFSEDVEAILDLYGHDRFRGLDEAIDAAIDRASTQPGEHK